MAVQEHGAEVHLATFIKLVCAVTSNRHCTPTLVGIWHPERRLDVLDDGRLGWQVWESRALWQRPRRQTPGTIEYRLSARCPLIIVVRLHSDPLTDPARRRPKTSPTGLQARHRCRPRLCAASPSRTQDVCSVQHNRGFLHLGQSSPPESPIRPKPELWSESGGLSPRPIISAIL